MADLLIYLLENYANWIVATPFILAITYVIHGLFFSSELHPKIDPSLWRPATDEEIGEMIEEARIRASADKDNWIPFGWLFHSDD